MTVYEKAMLDTLAYAEGTLGVSKNGYDVLVGFSTIIGWTPNTDIVHRCIKPTSNLTEDKIKQKGGKVCEDPSWDTKQNNTTRDDKLNSTAAGRYQFLGSSWATTTENLNLGFNAPMTEENQNKAAIHAIKKKRKVTESELVSAYSSFSGFEVVRKKLQNEWTSFKRNDVSAKKTPNDYWEVYKYAVNRYKQGNSTGGSNSSGKGTRYNVDINGDSVSSIGTSNTSRFIVNVPSDKNTLKVIYFWAGLENVISRDSQWNQIPSNIKRDYYIIMAAGVSSSAQNSLTQLKSVMNNFLSKKGIGPKKCCSSFKEYLMGYSAGGYAAFNNYSTSFDLVAFIDPSVPTNGANKPFNSNAHMIWGSSGMINLFGNRYNSVESKIKQNLGNSKKISGLNHGKAIEKWFQTYGSQLT
jgi:muramidase (phage lysozyme)